MPIQLNYTNPNTDENIPASYWIAKKATVDADIHTVEWVLYGYTSQASKNSGKMDFLKVFDAATWAQLGGISGATNLNQIATAIYNYALANNPFFAGGTIV